MFIDIKVCQGCGQLPWGCKCLEFQEPAEMQKQKDEGAEFEKFLQKFISTKHSYSCRCKKEHSGAKGLAELKKHMCFHQQPLIKKSESQVSCSLCNQNFQVGEK